MAHVHNIIFQGAVFDVPSEEVDTVLEEFQNIKQEGQRLEKLGKLPPLKYSDFENVMSRYESVRGSTYGRRSSQVNRSFGDRSFGNRSFGDRPRFSSPRRRSSYFSDDEDDDNDVDDDNFQGGYNRRSNFRHQKTQNRGLYYSDFNDRYGRNNRY